MDEAHISHDSENWPAWGSLPLDLYMVAQWDENSNVPNDQQRLQLARSYVSSGRATRAQYAEQAKQNTTQPSAEQISRILEPFRAPALRHVAERLLNNGGNFVWLRTHYNDDPEDNDDEQHRNLIQTITSPDFDEPDWAPFLYEGEIILSDPRFYNVEGTAQGWKSVLDSLPEIIDCRIPEWPHDHSYRQDLESRREFVRRDYMAWDRSYYHDNNDNNDKDEPDDYAAAALENRTTADIDNTKTEGAETEEAQQLFKSKTVECHSADCETVLLIEDAGAHSETEPATFRFLWLDDRAAVVRQMRATLVEACDFVTSLGKEWEGTCFEEAEVGEEYVRGGARGPPYLVGPVRGGGK